MGELFEYKGSLKIPPYTEGVQWMISKKVHYVGNKQLTKLKKIWFRFFLLFLFFFLTLYFRYIAFIFFLCDIVMCYVIFSFSFFFAFSFFCDCDYRCYHGLITYSQI